MSGTETPYRLSIEQVQKFLPHRYPFLLIDRVLEIHPTGNLSIIEASADKVGTRVVAMKNVTFNEPFFQGHFPAFSIMPGVLLIEAMAQAASFSVFPYFGSNFERLAKDFQCILVGVDSARFRKPVVPGDTLRFETTVTKCRGRLWGFSCVAIVEGQRVAEAEILANLISNAEPMRGSKGVDS
ncbi:MAG: 3-hydroxyacyl-ACP dehydratase FabZ [Bdellovibrionota bacterium]